MTVPAAEAVRDAMRRVEFGPVTRFANLSVVPLLDAAETDADYLTLDEALANGAAGTPASARPSRDMTFSS